MKKRILFVVLIIVLCSGCNANYKLTIKEDGTVDESVYASEDSTFYENYSKSSVGKVIGNLLSPYLDELNEKKYTVNTKVNETNGGASISKTHDSIADYTRNSILYNQFTDKINYEEDGNKITISAKGAFAKETQELGIFNVDTSTIMIELPYKVLENNADEVEGNIYIWKFTENDKEIREIRLVYDKTKIYNDNSYLNYIAIGIILLFLGVLVYMFYRFKNKRNSVNEI